MNNNLSIIFLFIHLLAPPQGLQGCGLFICLALTFKNCPHERAKEKSANSKGGIGQAKNFKYLNCFLGPT